MTHDNYSAKVTFAKATKNPLYMRILKILIDHPHGLKRNEVLNITHNRHDELVIPGWLCGPFHLLKYYGYADFRRLSRQCFWYATPKGENFYNTTLVKRDLV